MMIYKLPYPGIPEPEPIGPVGAWIRDPICSHIFQIKIF